MDNLRVTRYLKAASSRSCVREMNSDPPLCLRFYTSQLPAACFSDSDNILFSMLVCII